MTQLHLTPGRRRRHADRLIVGLVVGALVVLAAWGFTELVR